MLRTLVLLEATKKYGKNSIIDIIVHFDDLWLLH